MKRFLVLLMCLTLGVVCTASADDGLSVTVRNGTGYDFYYLYISPSNWDNWEDDLLQGEYLYDGEERVIVLSDEYGDECVFDIKAVDLDDDSYSLYEADLCAQPSVEITMDHYDQDNYDDGGEYSGYDDGYQEGYTEGYRDAFRDAYRQGYQDGLEDGRAME